MMKNFASLLKFSVRLRTLGAVLFVFLLLCSQAFPQCFKGELNGDGILTGVDVVLELNCFFLETGNCDSSFVDLNCDGMLTLTDIVILINATFLGESILDLLFDYPIVVDADDSSVPESLRSKYRDDAARLAFRIVDQVGGCVNDEVPLPPGLVRSPYNALIHVYNATALDARDSVVDLYDIHPLPGRYCIWGIYVFADVAEPWVKEWLRGNWLTRNPQVDRLTECFELQITKSYGFKVVPARPLNAAALGKQFKKIKGVYSVHATCAYFDGDDIAVIGIDDHWQIDYSAGCGDCMAGCMAHHFWRFKIYEDGRVEFMNSWGPNCSPDF